MAAGFVPEAAPVMNDTSSFLIAIAVVLYNFGFGRFGERVQKTRLCAWVVEAAVETTRMTLVPTYHVSVIYTYLRMQ